MEIGQMNVLSKVAGAIGTPGDSVYQCGYFQPYSAQTYPEVARQSRLARLIVGRHIGGEVCIRPIAPYMYLVNRAVQGR